MKVHRLSFLQSMVSKNVHTWALKYIWLFCASLLNNQQLMKIIILLCLIYLYTTTVSQLTDIKCQRWVLNPGLPVRESKFSTSGLLGKTVCRRPMCRSKSKLGGSDNSIAGSLYLMSVLKYKQKEQS